MRCCCSFSAALLVILSFAVLAPQTADARQYLDRPFSASLIPPLSTNGLDAHRTRSHFSLNILGGVLGRLEGVELGSWFNFEQDHVFGYQGAGGVNIALGDVVGVQTAGAANIVGHNLSVAQFAGAFNLVSCTLNGFQAATVNVAGWANGMQTGVANITRTGLGMQLGVANIAFELGGAQLGITNIAGRLEGYQQGIANIAGRGKGFQLGVVNIAGNLDGEALGLANIIGNGRHCLALGYSELGFVELGGKLGSPGLYTVYALGIETRTLDRRWLAEIGLGGHVPLDPFFIDIDVLTGNVRSVAVWDETVQNNVGRLRVCAGWSFIPGLAVTAGPTFNWTIAQGGHNLDLPVSGVPYMAIGSGVNAARIWPGFSLGLEFFQAHPAAR